MSAVRHPGLARVAAPVAFLLAVTIAVLLVRAGLQHGNERAVDTPAAVTTSERTVVVVKGDTLEAIAARSGTTVAAIRVLNPGLDAVDLEVGSRVRVQ